MKLLVDILGALGVITTVLVYQQKTAKRQLIWKMTTDIVWTGHYLALGAFSGMVTTGVAVLRSVVFLNKERKWAQSKLWLYIFLAASIGFSAAAWEGPRTLLTLIPSVACIIAFWIGNPMVTRLVSIPAGSMFLVYTILCHSMAGIVCEIFLVASAIVGVIRLDLKKKPAQPSEKA